jgi:hypothetical protein
MIQNKGGVNMPFGNRTGPDGTGPMTGRGAGYCAGYDAPGFMNPAAGRGLRRGAGRGFGRGRGMGFRRRLAPAAQAPAGYRYPAQPVQPTREEQARMMEAEKARLEAEAAEIQAELKEINKRMQELK